MVEVVQTHNLNLLHVHYAIPHASAAVNAKRILAEAGLNVPVVTTLHGTDITLLGKDASFKPVITHAINARCGHDGFAKPQRRHRIHI